MSYQSNLAKYLKSVQEEITRRGHQENHKNLVKEIKFILETLEGPAQDQQRQSEALKRSIGLVEEGIQIYEQQLRNEAVAGLAGVPSIVTHAEFKRISREYLQSIIEGDSAQKFIGG